MIVGDGIIIGPLVKENKVVKIDKEGCQCDICKRAARYHEIINKLSDEDREWMVKFYSRYMHEGMDGDVYAAKWKGEWPRSEYMRCSECGHNISRQGKEAMELYNDGTDDEN